MPRWRIGALKQDASETPFERFSKEQWFVEVNREEILESAKAVEWFPD